MNFFINFLRRKKPRRGHIDPPLSLRHTVKFTMLTTPLCELEKQMHIEIEKTLGRIFGEEILRHRLRNDHHTAENLRSLFERLVNEDR